MLFTFTIVLKLVFNLESFKILPKLIEINQLDAFSKSSAASGVARSCVKVCESALSYELHVFSMFWNIGGSIPSSSQSFFNFSINSSKELTLLEQRTLAQLLRVVLVVVNVLELGLLDCYNAWT